MNCQIKFFAGAPSSDLKFLKMVGFAGHYGQNFKGGSRATGQSGITSSETT
jgi:hypothetical protein